MSNLHYRGLTEEIKHSAMENAFRNVFDEFLTERTGEVYNKEKIVYKSERDMEEWTYTTNYVEIKTSVKSSGDIVNDMRATWKFFDGSETLLPRHQIVQ